MADSKSTAKLFSDKFRKIFDIKGNNKSDAENVNVNVNSTYSEITQHLFSREDINTAIKCLKPSIGYDKIHTNHLKFTSVILDKLIANLFSSYVLHNYMSGDILGGN